MFGPQPECRPAPYVLTQLRFPVPGSPTTSLSVAYGEGSWGTLLYEDSLWLSEASALNRLSKSALRDRTYVRVVYLREEKFCFIF